MNPDHPDGRALLATVLASPDDDAARLVLADWLEEHGEADRAEFIRVQVDLHRVRAAWGEPDRKRALDMTEGLRVLHHKLAALSDRQHELAADPARTLAWFGLPAPWARTARLTPYDSDAPGDPPYAVVERGFVAEVRCDLAVHAGGGCRRCLLRAIFDDALSPDPACGPCSGTGRVPGSAAAAFAAQPVERVAVFDYAPYWNGAGHAWYDCRRPRPSAVVPARAELPHAVFDRLKGGRGNRYKAYRTVAAAAGALSDALVDLGREAARGGAHPAGA